MINTNIDSKKVIGGFFWGVASKLLTGIKISCVVGSSMAFFSLTNCALPLMGVFSNTFVTISFFVISMIVRSLLSPVSILKLAAFYVPGLMAALSFMQEYRFLRFCVPMVCMVAFIVHPVGGSAWLYAMYWLIPMGLYWVDSKSIFAYSLAATFVAHAVGSTIWLYAEPMTAQVWLALIPVVAYERILFAVGMTLLYSVVCNIQSLANIYMKTMKNNGNSLHIQ